MPRQSGRSVLIEKLGDKLRKAAEVHRMDDVDYGNMDLPAGIEGGVAQLTDCRFMPIKAGKINAGQLMFYAAGIVKAPNEHGGVPIEGLRTSITEPLYNTPQRGEGRKTLADHVGRVQNYLKMLGADPDDLTADKLESTAAALSEAKPHFRFRTWKGSKQTSGPYKDQEPRVNHQWSGVCDFSANGEAEAVIDETDEEAETEETESAETGAEESAKVGEFAIDELTEQADADDEEAQAKLREIAVEAGVTEAKIDGAKNWAAVAKFIEAAREEGEDETADKSDEDSEDEEEEEAAAVPAKGEVYGYRPKDPKTKKLVKKPIECKVVSVDKEAATCTLKNLDNVKIVYEDVPFDKLEEVE